MVDITKTRQQPIEQFWEMTEDIRAGMLGVEGSGQHMQPMHPNCEREGRNIWFFVKKDADLVQAIGSGGHGHFCVIGRDHDYHACVSGRLTVENNSAMIDRFWNSATAAWFKGKDDPELTLVKMELDDGVAWGSVGTVKFGWEVLKANMSEHDPDVGARTHFSFVHQVGGSEQRPQASASDTPRYIPRQEGQV
ncbi:MAG: pyridoxamine 5'-phosphate oxidase family protein [Hyphomicrobiaceae bacterium]